MNKNIENTHIFIRRKSEFLAQVEWKSKLRCDNGNKCVIVRPFLFRSQQPNPDKTSLRLHINWSAWKTESVGNCEGVDFSLRSLSL